jgi:hypothetical protein
MFLTRNSHNQCQRRLKKKRKKKEKRASNLRDHSSSCSRPRQHVIPGPYRYVDHSLQPLHVDLPFPISSVSQERNNSIRYSVLKEWKIIGKGHVLEYWHFSHKGIKLVFFGRGRGPGVALAPVPTRPPLNKSPGDQPIDPV